MKLLVTGSAPWSGDQLSQIARLGHEIVFIQDERIPLATQGILEEDIEGVICNNLFIFNDIKAFKNLRYIQLISAGYDRVPMSHISNHEIAIFNARGVYSIPIAEFVVNGVLQLYKRSQFFFQNQTNCEWKKHRSILELNSKTICIVGCGNVGVACAKLFSAFNCRILGLDLYPTKINKFEKIYLIEQMNEVLSVSDIVVLTLPLTDQTKYLVGDDWLRAMKQDAILVNVSRGEIIDSDSLIYALNTGKIAGAVLDVFEEEPLNPKSPLWRMSNTIITPHNSFVGEHNQERLFKLVISNLISGNK